MQVSLRNALSISAMKPIDGPLDDLTLMKVAYSISTTAHVYFIERHLHVTEKDQLVKERDSAPQEAHMWRSELGKARGRVVILEGAVVRAEEKARVAEASGEAKAKEASQGEATAWTEKQELLAYVNMLQTQLQRQQLETKQVFEEKTESTNGETSLSTTKETEKDVDKACLSVSRTASMPGENVVHMSEDEVVNAQAPVGENEWNDIQATEARVSDVKRNI
ncbi:unnamed protein product [Brassica rapa subsp. trilocularis]